MRQQNFHLTVLTYANKETLFPPLQANRNPASETPHSIFEVCQTAKNHNKELFDHLWEMKALYLSDLLSFF